jgi:hypothetical protein
MLPFIELLDSTEHSELVTAFNLVLLADPPPEPTAEDWIQRWQLENSVPFFCLAKMTEGFVLRFPDLADFLIPVEGCQIGTRPGPETDTETLRHLLLDHVLPRVLAYQGRLVLHAGAVCVGRRVISFLGETGSGKSTLVASLHAAGYPLLSDDGLVLMQNETGVLALPTYHSLRLWPDAVAGVFAQQPALTPMAHYSSKQRVLLDEDVPQANEPIPLAALYVLTPTGEDDGIVVSRHSSRDACMDIIRNAFQLDPTDRERAAGVFAAASEVARRVPAFTLSYPREFASLPAVRAAILSQQALWAVCDGDDLDKG